MCITTWGVDDEPGLGEEPSLTQPCVIVGGMISAPGDYRPMADVLSGYIGQPVAVVNIQRHDWLGLSARAGWRWHLDRLDDVVRRAAASSPTSKITLVGHSVGGILGRLYLSRQPVLGRAYCGVEYVDHLITLGSPHNSRLATWLGYWQEHRVPGAMFAPEVRYSAVGGAAIHGDLYGGWVQRHAHVSYRLLSGQGDTWGDGLVPLGLALLEGAVPISLDGVTHSPTTPAPWYGTPTVVRSWWRAAAAAGMA
jgi:pimeloyl-ACP methyl ester carboxylesterase